MVDNKLNEIQNIQFGTLTSEEYIKYSVCEVTIPSSNGSDRKQTGTPYDLRMGPIENGVLCLTCGGDNRDCPGHFGHKVLPIPIYNSMFMDTILKVLQCVCPLCSRPRILPEHADIENLLRLNKNARLKHIAKRAKTIGNCPWDDCAQCLPVFYLDKSKRDIRRTFDTKENSVVFSAGEAFRVFEKISPEHENFLGFNKNLSENEKYIQNCEDIFATKTHIHQNRVSNMIITVLPITPPCTRPYVVTDGEKRNDDLTELYNAILKACIRIEEDRDGITPPSSRGRRRGGKLQPAERQKVEEGLITYVHALHNNKNELTRLSSGGRAHKCLTSRIGSKKDCRIHGNIGGKRCDYTARTVIVGGGLDLRQDQVGVPKYICQKLTKSEIVGEWNIFNLQKTVEQGKVNRVVRDSTIKRLDLLHDTGRQFILQIGDVIERQLQANDVVIINRQPSLRVDGSMLALRVLPIDDLTFRLPLWITPGLNADFDGDEINLHVPQSISATADALILMGVTNHIVTGQRNAPVNGIVQDGLVGSYILTNTWSDGSKTMVDVGTVTDIITAIDGNLQRYNSLLQRAHRYYPEFIKYKNKKYTISQKIPGGLAISAIFPENFCYEKKTETNAKFPTCKIQDGVILPDSGPLCKKTIGAKGNAIHHYLVNEYSPHIALRFLSDVQQFIDRWLPTHGFSFGFRDCLSSCEDQVSDILKNMDKKVENLLDVCNHNPDDMTEAKISTTLNSAMNSAMRLTQDSMFRGERNALNIMRISGAKGSSVNTCQISSFVGQQFVKGRRVPKTLSDGTRVLSYFDRGENSADSRGFVRNPYIKGLTPQETHMHAVAGRDGILGTALKTAVSGYIQKRIGAKISDLRVCEDGTVRNHHNEIIQFIYGDDGLDAKKISHVKGVDFPIAVNPYSIARRLNSDARKEGITSVERTLTDAEVKLLLEFINSGALHIKSDVNTNTTSNTRAIYKRIFEKVEICEAKIPIFCAEIRNSYERSKVQSGELVGLIAESNIGEPTTQLALNTFHFTGRAEKDVSLGVPRLNEILNATPSHNQKKGSTVIYFNIEELDEKRKRIIDGDSQKEKLRGESLSILQSITKDFEETTVSTFLKSYEMKYLPEEIDPDKGISPIGILTYREYDKEWWVDLHESLNGEFEIVPESWVVVLKFNTEEMFCRGINLRHIVEKIEEHYQGKYHCVPSPNILGTIEVYCNFSEIKPYILNELNVGDTEDVITEDNANYFTCRQIVVKDVINVPISGVIGIDKAYPREDELENEWLMDVSHSPLKIKYAVKRFQEILAMPQVDSTRTICDDVHTILEVLGIEAARKFLIREITRVISFDGTYVDPRHFQILVDAMTCSGEITSVGRNGINRDVGPIAKIMFEESVENAMKASLFSEKDKLKSISSSVMFGKTAIVGSGSVKIRPKNKAPVKPIRTKTKPKPEKSIEIDTFGDPPKQTKTLRVGSRRKNIIK